MSAPAIEWFRRPTHRTAYESDLERRYRRACAELCAKINKQIRERLKQEQLEFDERIR